MGNDIFSSVIEKKKNMILEYSNIFFRFTVDNKNKITKTLSSIIDIYIDTFYLNKENDFSNLDNYFSLQNSKDKLLKETILSTIKFYQMNNIGDKIESYKGTIVVISNVIYLAITLSDKCFKNCNGNVEIILEQFINKYKSKIRLRNNDTIEDLKNALIGYVKRDVTCIKKAMKSFSATNYSIKVQRLFDSDNNYLVELDYELKSLSKYNQTEINQAIVGNIMYDHSIIMLEQTALKIVYDYLSGASDNRYFVPIPFDLFDKQKYKKMIDEIFKNKKLKDKIVILLDYEDVSSVSKKLSHLKEEGFLFGTYKVNSLKMNRNSFDNLDFVLVNSQFLEMYDGYQEIWKAKGVKFIIS